MVISDFIQQYYIDPIKYNTGYNIVNTLTYAVILIIAIIGVYKLLKRMNVKIDKNFFYAVIPFIAFGSILRVYEDFLEASNAAGGPLTIIDVTGTARNLLLVTPLIYITIFIITISALVFSLLVQKYAKIPYYKVWFSTGAIISLLVLLLIPFVDFSGMALIFGIVLGIDIAVFVVRKYAEIKKMKISSVLANENYLLIMSQMLDASATFVALSFYNYWEQHVLPSFFINIFGPVSLFFLKLPIILLAVYYIDKEVTDTEKRTFLKMAVLVLGMAPGLRDTLRLGAGV